MKGRSSRIRCHILFRGVLALLTLCVVIPVSADTPTEEEQVVLDPVERFHPDSYGDEWLISDRDGDGVTDYAVRLNERGYKLLEAMDYNYDGRMDDFYFYSNDVLQRQELDSNFDDQVDIWIYMWHGVYVERWERDTDFDGQIDMTREYGEQE